MLWTSRRDDNNPFVNGESFCDACPGDEFIEEAEEFADLVEGVTYTRLMEDGDATDEVEAARSSNVSRASKEYFLPNAGGGFTRSSDASFGSIPASSRRILSNSNCDDSERLPS